MNFFSFLIVSFLSAFGLGYLKFFSSGYLCDEVYNTQDKEWVIQFIGALLTIGPVVIYFISAPLAASIKKSKIMAMSCLLTGLILYIGYRSNWMGTIWFYLIISGLNMGIFSAAKMSCVPIQAQNSKFSITTINASLSISFILGMLIGCFLGSYAYENHRDMAAQIVIYIFLAATLPALFCIYSNEKLESFTTAKQELVKDSLNIFSKFTLHLSSSAILWGIAGALSLAVTAYLEIQSISDATKSTLIPLFAAIGAIIGNALSTKLKASPFKMCLLFIFLLFASIPLLPISVSLLKSSGVSVNIIYNIVVIQMILMGTYFGFATNIIDSEYLKKIGQLHKEACGAALQSVMISLSSLLIGGSLGFFIYNQLVNSMTQFFLLAFFTILSFSIVLILNLKKGLFQSTIIIFLNTILIFVLKLRYKIKVKGLDKIENSNEGILFLPNHPAEIDPVILGSILMEKFNPKPVVVEDFYFMRVIHLFMKLINSIPMPNMDKGAGKYKQLRIEKKIDEIGTELKEGNNILMYPAGRLMRSGLENLGASSGVKRLLEISPNTRIVLLRTTGLWGSSFSTAQSNGNTPDLFSVAKNAFKILLSNLIFFSPKRIVEIEVTESNEPLTTLNKQDLNRKLENFYNKLGCEEMNLVSSKFWKKDLPTITQTQNNNHTNLDQIPMEKQNEITEKFAKEFKYSKNDCSPNSDLASELGMDSLTKSEVLLWLDDEYEISDVELTEINTIADIISSATGNNKKETTENSSLPFDWEDKNRPSISNIEETTLQEAFLKSADRLTSNNAIADEISGVMKWNKLKLATLVLSQVIKEIPSQNIGIMLPASNAATITFFATLLANKTPVMLNWTVGKKNLEHAVETAEITTVLTSATFLDKLQHADFGKVDQLFYSLEDIRREKITITHKLKGMLRARKNSTALLKDLGLSNIDTNSTAVILFTSGSESAPKGVPLSHSNLISNIKGASEAISFNENDVLYGFLPPFHSFGLTVTTLLPLLLGLKVVFHPNPTESRKIAKGVKKYGVTYLCSTPTFLDSILKSAPAETFKTIHTYVCGAEKCPEALRKKVTGLETNAQVLEGYGITECSPVLSINKHNENIEGVGKLFTNINIKIVHPETFEILPKGEAGLICVNGPSIFNGYLKIDNDPFIYIEKIKFYNTGDLGYFTNNNNLILSGRMKRFVKVAGEMISLPAMEEALSNKWPSNENGPTVALHAEEIPGSRPVITLFTTLDLTKELVMLEIKKAGFSNLAKISKVQNIETLPILGTGKTDYQTLKKLAS